jgi:glyoxylase-like metal-dependent hydrolase (beta-lactamase superfamily II)
MTVASLAPAFTFASGASAQTQTAEAANAAVYRFRLGAFAVTVVSDGQIGFPAFPAYAPNAAEADVRAALTRNFMDPVAYTLDSNVILVDTGRHRVLIDAGWAQGFNPAVGHTATRLAAAGIDPGSIDTVVLSHAHPDHIGGLTTGERPQATFPRAEIVISEPEWAHWTASSIQFGQMLIGDDFKPVFMGAAQRNLVGLRDRVRRVPFGREIVPGITLEAAPGHTPGHGVVRIVSGRETLLYTADCFHDQAFDLDQPSWRTAFDFDPPAAEVTRRRILDQAAADRVMLIGYHMPFPALGHVVRVGDAYRWMPMRWLAG